MKNKILKYIQLENELCILQKKIDKIYEEKREIILLFEKYIFENKLYKPVENLKKYEGKPLDKITVISETGDFDEWSCFDCLEVREGHLYVNDESCIKEYDENTGKYHTHTYGYKSEGEKIIGYINLVEVDKKNNTQSLYSIVQKHLENEGKNGSKI